MLAANYRRFRSLLLAFLVGVLLSTMCIAAERPGIDIALTGNALFVSSSASIYLRIGGPNDYFEEVRGDAFVQWSPGVGAPDGLYSYDCYVSAGVTRDGSFTEEAMERALEAVSASTHGVFRVDNGMLVDDEPRVPVDSPRDDEVPDLRSEQAPSGLQPFWDVIGSLLNALVPSAHALQTVSDDLQVNGYLNVTGTAGGYMNFSDTTNSFTVSGGDFYLFGDTPQIYFYDLTTTDYNWYFDADDESFQLMDTVDANDNIVFQVDALGGSSNLANSIMINILGDIRFADSAVFIDRSADEVGIGTTSPAGSLHILDDALPELILEDSGAGSTRWELEASTAELHVYGYNSTSFTSVYPFRINNDAKSNALVLGNISSSTSNVGMGTNDPEVGLHLLHYDANGIIKVQEKNAATARRFQVQLENNGATGFLFTDTSVANRQWQNAMLTNGDFAFSFIGTGGAELQITPSGEVRMGPGPGINFQLKAGGDLSIPNGKVTATAFESSSSRSVKQDFRPIDEGEVLDKLLALEITEWEYKNPEVRGRHLGPTAEEFHELFGFGSSEKHIYPADMASVGLVAVRQLQRQAEERDAKIDRQSMKIDTLERNNAELKIQNARIALLEEQNSGLKAANTELEDRLANLEELVQRMSTTSM